MRSIKDYVEFLSALKPSIIDQFEFHSDPPLGLVFNNPRLIVVLNHSSPLSWIPAITCLALEAHQAGAGNRIPRGVVDKWFYSNPLTAKLAEYMSQSTKPQGFDELLAILKSEENTDLVIFPEGALSFFGPLDQIQSFRSPRFMELSILSGTPILIVTHWGSETWSQPISLPKEWGFWIQSFAPFFGSKISELGSINWPWLSKKIPLFSMSCKLWAPSLYASDLSQNPLERRHQLESQAEELRAAMSEMLEELKSKSL